MSKRPGGGSLGLIGSGRASRRVAVPRAFPLLEAWLPQSPQCSRCACYRGAFQSWQWTGSGMSASERATNPSLYEINTRVWLHELGERLGRIATLDDVADEELDRIAEWGFDWVWLLGVWATGPKSTEVARVHPD